MLANYVVLTTAMQDFFLEDDNPLQPTGCDAEHWVHDKPDINTTAHATTGQIEYTYLRI